MGKPRPHPAQSSLDRTPSPTSSHNARSSVVDQDVGSANTPVKSTFKRAASVEHVLNGETPVKLRRDIVRAADHTPVKKTWEHARNLANDETPVKLRVGQAFTLAGTSSVEGAPKETLVRSPVMPLSLLSLLDGSQPTTPSLVLSPAEGSGPATLQLGLPPAPLWVGFASAWDLRADAPEFIPPPPGLGCWDEIVGPEPRPAFSPAPSLPFLLSSDAPTNAHKDHEGSGKLRNGVDPAEGAAGPIPGAVHQLPAPNPSSRAVDRRMHHVACLVREALLLETSKDFVPIAKLLRASPSLQREAFGSIYAVSRATERCPDVGLVLDCMRKNVRLRSSHEVTAEEVEHSDNVATDLRLPQRMHDSIAPFTQDIVSRASSGNRVSPTTTSSTLSNRAVNQLRQLLDFYFEPFALQHNRFLLDTLVATCAGPPIKRGPWDAEVLAAMRFGFTELRGLGRIDSALSRLNSTKLLYMSLGQLKHVAASSDGLLALRNPPEIRSYVSAPGASPKKAMAAVRFLTAAREQQVPAPPSCVSMLSYSMCATSQEQTTQGEQFWGRVKRQLLMHRTDIMCLQGFPIDTSADALALKGVLAEEGYQCVSSRSGETRSNVVFWAASRLDLRSHQESASALALDFRITEDPSVSLRVVCARPALSPGSLAEVASLLQSWRSMDSGPIGPIGVCADLAALGGVEGASLVPELADMASAMQEVVGEELAVPMPQSAEQGRPSSTLSTFAHPATCLNRLHCPDGIFFRGMTPVAALSGHTEGCLSTMSAVQVQNQIPALRLPLVVTFDWRSSPGSAAQVDKPFPEGAALIEGAAVLPLLQP